MCFHFSMEQRSIEQEIIDHLLTLALYVQNKQYAVNSKYIQIPLNLKSYSSNFKHKSFFCSTTMIIALKV